MLETQSLITATSMKPGEIPEVLIQLSKEGWKPALLESQRTFLQLAGVADKIGNVRNLNLSEPFNRGLHSSVAGGDVFFKDEDLYYIVISMADVFYEEDADTQPQLEIGLISSNNTNLNERLKIFTTTVENVIKKTLENEKTEDIKFD